MELLNKAMADELSAVHQYMYFLSASRKLFESLVDDEERHFGQFDTERENLKKFGDEYLALQSMERSKASSGPGGGAE